MMAISFVLTGAFVGGERGEHLGKSSTAVLYTAEKKVTRPLRWTTAQAYQQSC
jgi:hypothetical protein